MTKVALTASASRASSLLWALALLALVVPASPLFAQDGPGDHAGDVVAPADNSVRIGDNVREEDGIVIYEPDFFARYNPVTALDMVSRTPGFSVSRGSNSRGFGQASGNVLIDGERPSSKSDNVSDILSRIPAGQVEQIELIRGATGGLDTQGQSVVANVVLHPSTGSGFAEVGAGLEAGEVGLRAELAYDGEAGPVDYLVSGSSWSSKYQSQGTEQLVRPDQTGQRREEVDNGTFGRLSFNARTEFDLGDRDTLRLNGQFSRHPRTGDEISNRFDLGSDVPDVVRRTSDNLSHSYELGGDYERDLGGSTRLKVIGLFRRTNRDSESALRSEFANGDLDRRESLSISSDGEDIGRVEMDWRAGRHSMQASGEFARNFVESDFQLFLTVDGVFQEVELTGGDTRVSETRSDWMVSDSWSVAPAWTVDAGLGFEVSTIRQTGDIDRDRTFRFLKPSLAITYSPSRSSQLRIRGQREVSQLNFFDFVSSADFENEDLEFGNPELEPERTWALEATYERRFGEIGVAEIRLFYDAIEEVQDLLPLGETFEIVGNIGDGRRYGVDLDLTVGLAAVGLDYAQLDFGALFQSTSVTDPVTGLERSLSGESDFRGRVGYRQEAPELALSWGGSYRLGSSETSFGLDELEFEDEGGELELFVEKVLAGNIKVRLRGENLLESASLRERTVFDGPRTRGSVLFRELRRRSGSREISLTLSRSF